MLSINLSILVNTICPPKLLDHAKALGTMSTSIELTKKIEFITFVKIATKKEEREDVEENKFNG